MTFDAFFNDMTDSLKNSLENIIMTRSQECYEEGHKDGINTAWKVLREILMYPATSIREIFGTEKLGEIITKYSVEEMEEKLRDYGARQVRVGDEVVINGYAHVVTRVTDRGIDTVRCDGQTYFFYKDTWDELLRTGRHFYELEIILKALRGDDANETN